MSIYLNPLDEIFKSISNQGVRLIPSEYNIGTPVAIPDSQGFDNTSIELVAKNLQSTYSGQVTLTYRRLDIAELKEQTNLIVPCHVINDTRDVYKLINRHYGTIFTDDDIVIRDLTEEEKQIPGSLLLETKPTSLGWVGSVDVSTKVGGFELKHYVMNLDLGGYDYPASRLSKPFGHVYSYWRDFSKHYTALQQVQLGSDPASIDILVAALKDITGDNWRTEGRLRYSLQGATVVDIATPFIDQGDFYNNRYGHAIKIQLDGTFLLGLEGYLVLHYDEYVPA